MHKGYLLSILFHLTVFLLLVMNVNLLKKTKKISYQKFSIHIGPIKKDLPKPPQLEKDITKITQIAPEITIKLDPTNIADSKQNEIKEKKDTVIEKQNEIKEKVKEIPPKEIKKIEKKEAPKDNAQKNLQKISKKSTPNKKKSPPSTKKKKVEKQKPKEDIFSKLVGNTPPVNLNTKSATLDENDLLKIQEQLKKHWNTTPCSNDMSVVVKIMIDANCNIINRSLNNSYTSSSQLRACAESALKATQKVDKFELDPKSCKKYSQEFMVIDFNKSH